MKILIIIVGFLTWLAITAHGQVKRADVIHSYELGKNFYIKGDYLSAYKYLLIFKYCNLDSLSNLKDKGKLQNIDEVLRYCETHIKSGLSEYFSIKAKGFTEPINVDSLKKLILERSPKLN